MGWLGNNKSRFKKKQEYKWWEDPKYLAAEEQRALDYPSYDYGYGYGGGYGYYYKPRFDMSVGLETRVKQLIRTITGKNLKLARAHGWGSDDKYFYYNADDLQNATDDEVLGRILHQLAKELYLDKKTIKEINDKKPDYRHLLNTLEDNRSDAQLQARYLGTPYYAEEVWESRKFEDNPINRYEPLITNFKELQRAAIQRGISLDEKLYNRDRHYRADCDAWMATENARRQGQYNPSWEFCFNISALQNKETEWDFWEPNTLSNFEKAVPFIQKYLAASTFEEALQIYPDIEKYYPKPNKQQQNQMDREMSQTEGLSDADMRNLRERREREEAIGAAQVKGRSQDMDNILGELKRGKKGSLEKGDLQLEQNLAEYKERLVRLRPAIYALHYLIRSIIKDNAIKRYRRPFKRGKLDAKSMYKYVATDNIRIFKKPKVISDKKYTMAILVDQSGSMDEQDENGVTNSSYAVDGAIILAEVFEMLGLPYEIIGFDGTAYIFKKFNSTLKREYIPSLRSTNGGTDDHNALQTIKERIFNFDPNNAYHKGIFVISDGMGHDPQKMRDLVNEIEKNHNASVFGIGIGEMEKESLEESYNHSLKIEDTKDLPSALVQLIRGQFKRG